MDESDGRAVSPLRRLRSLSLHGGDSLLTPLRSLYARLADAGSARLALDHPLLSRLTTATRHARRLPVLAARTATA
jgi:hypothetical protein